MKTKNLLLTAALMLMIFLNSITAQVNESEVITLTSNLNTTMYLDMSSAGYMPVIFDFNTLNDYKNGLGGYDNWDYFHMASINSTANWKFGVRSVSPFLHYNGNTEIPTDNIGITILWQGLNTIINNADEIPLGIIPSEKILLEYDGINSNAGDYYTNNFILFYEMGTQSGDMKQKSIFMQNLKKGSYTMDIQYVVTEIID